ncbi:MAG: Lrp/AsnC family transcriptional regulator [Alistipes sp.]|nr:Lrp/AsnC family transcriptional regulator [Alistipes sp.]
MSKEMLDAIDRKILKFLVKNARMPYLEIARECGISGAAIHQRIKKLEDTGVVLGSRMIVNPKKVGLDVCAFVNLRIQDPMMTNAAIERIKHIPEVVECHFITGEYSAMVKLYCVDNEHLMRTIFDHILRIPGVTTSQTYISLNELFSNEPHINYLDR